MTNIKRIMRRYELNQAELVMHEIIEFQQWERLPEVSKHIKRASNIRKVSTFELSGLNYMIDRDSEKCT